MHHIPVPSKLIADGKVLGSLGFTAVIVCLSRPQWGRSFSFESPSQGSLSDCPLRVGSFASQQRFKNPSRLLQHFGMGQAQHGTDYRLRWFSQITALIRALRSATNRCLSANSQITASIRALRSATNRCLSANSQITASIRALRSATNRT